MQVSIFLIYFICFISFLFLYFYIFSRFLEMTEDEKEGILNKHRFLVQTKIITDDIYTRISSIPQADRIDEVIFNS